MNVLIDVALAIIVAFAVTGILLGCGVRLHHAMRKDEDETNAYIAERYPFPTEDGDDEGAAE